MKERVSSNSIRAAEQASTLFLAAAPGGIDVQRVFNKQRGAAGIMHEDMCCAGERRHKYDNQSSLHEYCKLDGTFFFLLLLLLISPAGRHHSQPIHPKPVLNQEGFLSALVSVFLADAPQHGSAWRRGGGDSRPPRSRSAASELAGGFSKGFFRILFFQYQDGRAAGNQLNDAFYGW